MKPAEQMCRMSTTILAANVMDYMKVTKTERLEQLYTKHMAILVFTIFLIFYCSSVC